MQCAVETTRSEVMVRAANGGRRLAGTAGL